MIDIDNPQTVARRGRTEGVACFWEGILRN